MGEAKWKADYGEPWKTVPSQSSARLALIEERHGLQSRFLIADDMAERIVACVNALSGITNVEALGSLLELAEIAKGICTCTSPGPFEGHYSNCLGEVARLTIAALYAPQASEAKPL